MAVIQKVSCLLSGCSLNLHLLRRVFLPPRRIQQAVPTVWWLPSGPVSPTGTPPASGGRSLPWQRWRRCSRAVFRALVTPSGESNLSQAQLVGGQFFVAVDAEGVSQDGAILGAQGAEQRFLTTPGTPSGRRSAPQTFPAGETGGAPRVRPPHPLSADQRQREKWVLYPTSRAAVPSEIPICAAISATDLSSV